MAGTTTETKTVTITVDGVDYAVLDGMLLIDAITEVVGFDMPRFCHHDRLEPVGMCRMCMAQVENRGRWTNVATCTLRVMDGMQVQVHSEAAQQARRMTLELLLVNHPLDCPICDKGGECMLQDQTISDGPDVARTVEPRRKFLKPIPISRTVLLDRERCVHCARCTRFVDEIAGEKTIELINRGYHTEISPAFDGEYDSHFAGNTCDICPVGALTSATFRFRSRPWEMSDMPSVAPYGPEGSSIYLSTRENVIRRALPRENRAVNDVWIADRERFDYDFVLHPARLDLPLVRNRATGELEPATWEDALAAAVDGLAAAIEAGRPVGGVGSTVCSLEEQYTFGKLVRQVMGSANLTTARPLDLELRAGLIPTYDRLEQARTFFCVGEPLDELPIAWLRIYKAVRRRGARLITLNARSEHARLAASFNLDCEPGREAEVVGALLNLIHSTKRHNTGRIRAHTAGWSELNGTWAGYTAERAGVDPARLEALAERLVGADDLVMVSGQVDGRPDGTALRDAAWNLALMLGVPGMERGGWLEHQLNANTRGASDMGLRPDCGPGYTPLDAPGLDLDGLLSAEPGALLIMGSDLVADTGNPFQAVRNQWLNQSRDGEVGERLASAAAQRAEALRAAGFVVVTELFRTATAELADVVLPATCFAEESGTYVNLEGRAQYASQAVRPIIGVRSDLSILNSLAGGLAVRLGKAWTPLDEETALAEIRTAVPAYTAVTREAMLAGDGVLTELPPPGGRYRFVALT